MHRRSLSCQQKLQISIERLELPHKLRFKYSYFDAPTPNVAPHMPKVIAYLRHNGGLKVNTEQHWSGNKNFSHTIFRNPKVVKVLD